MAGLRGHWKRAGQQRHEGEAYGQDPSAIVVQHCFPLISPSEPFTRIGEIFGGKVQRDLREVATRR